MVFQVNLNVVNTFSADQLQDKELCSQQASFPLIQSFLDMMNDLLNRIDAEKTIMVLDITVQVYPYTPSLITVTPHVQPAGKTAELLSLREVEVLRLVCDGLTNKEIAGKLFISLETVKTHRKHIREKTDAKNTAGVIKAVGQLAENS